MHLNLACGAIPTPSQGLKKKHNVVGMHPVVISAKRYDGMQSRANQREHQERLQAVEEEQRYKQYLIEGNKALMEHMPNVSAATKDDDELQASRDAALAAKVKDPRTTHLLEEKRKERIMRANNMLMSMKPGPRALQQALYESDVYHQRKYYEGLTAEIKTTQRQHDFRTDQMCPETLIPFGNITEEQVKAEEVQRAVELRDFYLKDMAERKDRKALEKEEEIAAAIIDREHCRLLHEKEQRELNALKAKKREFCRLAYKEAVQEKAARAKHERISNAIDDRIICVDVTARRELDKRYNQQLKDMRAKQICEREARALAVCCAQRAQQTGELKQQQSIVDRHEAETEMDEARRQCQKQQLAKERHAYELVEREQAEAKQQLAKEIRRYEFATRLRNASVNEEFTNSEKRRHNIEAAELRNILYGQREQFLQQRQDEMMRITACQEDPYLQDDVRFFDKAVEIMQDSQEKGRPLYPIAKAVEIYKRENLVDLQPEGKSVQRNRLRDYCWPGYHTKADLAYRKYEHRENCRVEMERDRHTIFNNCIKITKMAADEQPYKQCESNGLIKCYETNNGNLIRQSSSHMNLFKPKVEKIAREFALSINSGDGCSEIMIAKNAASQGSSAKKSNSQDSSAAKQSHSPTASSKPDCTLCVNAGAKCAGRCTAGAAHRLRKSQPDLTKCWTARPQPAKQATHTNYVQTTKVLDDFKISKPQA
ncbi:maker85 [Drosophila busckii]|uniref:Maker85 n=1 Tax=Drosophila busckii TaxID=30019 RepID=A0A0M4EVI9_DROBS|nr:calponin homology domain-containing protein DDB_G0272472 [Drosophila busckii]ALC41900.1 maker85 [Drosophila busckii]